MAGYDIETVGNAGSVGGVFTVWVIGRMVNAAIKSPDAATARGWASWWIAVRNMNSLVIILTSIFVLHGGPLCTALLVCSSIGIRNECQPLPCRDGVDPFSCRYAQGFNIAKFYLHFLC